MLFTAPAYAQTFNVSGYIKDASESGPLVGATVAVHEQNSGTITDAEGFYTLSLPPGKHTLEASYLGYQNTSRTITITNTDKKVNLILDAATNELTEVQVEAFSARQKLNDTRMGVEFLASRDAKLLPALMGEVDLMKVLQLKPGVQSGTEGSSGLFVRGGSADQNLVLLDNALLYNPSHLLGFFSTFNSDAVKSVELYKGGFPAEFGGRLSSVVDVRLQEGNYDEVKVSGGLGLISSRLTVEGPVAKDKASFIFSGRRTYLDVFTRMINKMEADNADFNPIPDYYFYDLNGKLTYKINKRDELSVSSYYGHDSFGFNDEDFRFGFDWGNRIANISWQHKFNSHFYMRTSANTTSYQYNISNKIDSYSLGLSSSIRDVGFKTDFDLLLSKEHSLKFGAMATRHAFSVGRVTYDSDDDTQDYGGGSNYKATEFGTYISDDYQVNALLSFNYGMRFSGFNSSGKTYLALEPRASAKYSLNENLSVKASYASMMQYLHLVSNSGASMPTDIWFPSTKGTKPQRSQQTSAGVNYIFGHGKYLFSNELYYKWMHRQIDFKDGANLFINDNLENEFLFGKGESYGNEIYLEKLKGRTTGWIGYTLSWAYRQFEGINGGRRFPTSFDRRHDLSIVLLHKLNKRLHLTAAFVYGTGNAYSLPVARFAFQDIEGDAATIVPIYADRNSFRLASYHRLDLGAVLKLKPKHGESDLTFSVYNVYNRRNPYFVYFEQVRNSDRDETLGFRAKQVSLFPVVPSVTYNFKF
ncbi:carboxypeptidase-like regulatory domain-containing protein [Pontibacter silvestris]|uniref:Carboxypeptidase-like regulatory domain-containing protein n=1 Tax=Pontibacter silvestris TaxID=2305183 RepID=A0ABW4WZ25_9BACT|nr:TonB-dependent receptor [Pontibacter silvestris]MCC9135460.1 TonB-dependent receptor [Pontibacter silvestris]